MKKYNLSNEQATKLLNVNIGLIKKVANRHKNSLFSYDEVLAIAKESFLIAANNFNEEKGKLSTYAVATMEGHILNEKRNYWKHMCNKQSFTTGERVPVNDTIKLTPGSFKDSDDFVVPHLVNNEQHIDNSICVNKLLRGLSPRHKDVLMLRYFKEWDYKEIGEKFNVSYQRAAQIHDEAIVKLKKYVKVK